MNPVANYKNCKVTLKYKQPYPNNAFFRKRRLAGKAHRGIDFAPKDELKGQPFFIIAPVTGEVIFAGRHTQFGNMVVIKSVEHGREYLHMLCHLRSISRQTVMYGKRIRKGIILGLMGRTGTATGVHLHYQVEIRLDRQRQTHPWAEGYWKHINPSSYLT